MSQCRVDTPVNTVEMSPRTTMRGLTVEQLPSGLSFTYGMIAQDWNRGLTPYQAAASSLSTPGSVLSNTGCSSPYCISESMCTGASRSAVHARTQQLFDAVFSTQLAGTLANPPFTRPVPANAVALIRLPPSSS